MLYDAVGGHAVQHQVLYRIMVDENPKLPKTPLGADSTAQHGLLYGAVGGDSVQHQVLYRIMVGENPKLPKTPLGGREAAPKEYFAKFGFSSTMILYSTWCCTAWPSTAPYSMDCCTASLSGEIFRKIEMIFGVQGIYRKYFDLSLIHI